MGENCSNFFKIMSKPYIQFKPKKRDSGEKLMKIANTRFDRIDSEILRWEPCPNTIPENAVPGGKFTNGERLFIGRQRIKQNKEEFIPGYILPSKMELIVPYGTGTKR